MQGSSSRRRAASRAGRPAVPPSSRWWWAQAQDRRPTCPRCRYPASSKWPAAGEGAPSLLHAGTEATETKRPRATNVESRKERGIRSACRLMRSSELVNWTIRVTQDRSSRNARQPRDCKRTQARRRRGTHLARRRRSVADGERSRAPLHRSPHVIGGPGSREACAVG